LPNIQSYPQLIHSLWKNPVDNRADIHNLYPHPVHNYPRDNLTLRGILSGRVGSSGRVG
jgi:hypothetical protein